MIKFSKIQVCSDMEKVSFPQKPEAGRLTNGVCKPAVQREVKTLSMSVCGEAALNRAPVTFGDL